MCLLEFMGVSRWKATEAQFDGAVLLARGLQDISFLAEAWTKKE